MIHPTVKQFGKDFLWDLTVDLDSADDPVWPEQPGLVWLEKTATTEGPSGTPQEGQGCDGD